MVYTCMHCHTCTSLETTLYLNTCSYLYTHWDTNHICMNAGQLVKLQTWWDQYRSLPLQTWKGREECGGKDATLLTGRTWKWAISANRACTCTYLISFVNLTLCESDGSPLLLNVLQLQHFTEKVQHWLLFVECSCRDCRVREMVREGERWRREEERKTEKKREEERVR